MARSSALQPDSELGCASSTPHNRTRSYWSGTSQASPSANTPSYSGAFMKVSVIMPVYNERNTLRLVVERVLAVPLELELICVDDGSRDGSREILGELQ